MWGKEPRLLTGPLRSLSTRAGSGLAFGDIAVFASLTSSSTGAPQLQFKALLLWRHPASLLYACQAPHLRLLRLLVPSLCSGTWNATHSLRSHSYAHTLTHRFPPPTPPSYVYKPGRFPFVIFCGPLVLLSRGHFPPGFPWPASFLFCPSVLAEPWERRGSRGGVTTRAELWEMAGTAGLASGLRPVCFPLVL